MTQLNESRTLTQPMGFGVLTLPTEFLEGNEKEHVPYNPDPEPSSSDSLSKKKKRDKKKKRRKHRKNDSSDPSLSNNSDSSDYSDYRRKRLKNNSHQEQDPIKLCASLTESC